MEDDLSKLDPLFAAPPGKSTLPPDVAEQEGNPLAEIDPIFASPIGPSADASKPSASTPPPPRDNTPEVAGGVAGSAVGFFAPKYENPKLTTARADYAGSKAAEGQLRGELTRMQGDRLDAVDNARFAIADAQAEVSMARQELNAAEEAARKLNALPEPVVSPSAADNVVKGASDVEGSLSRGALTHSEKMGEIREANQVRKGIAGYKQGLPTTERVPLTGYTQSSRLIVPNELANAPVKTAAQIEAENRLKVAKENQFVLMRALILNRLHGRRQVCRLTAQKLQVLQQAKKQHWKNWKKLEASYLRFQVSILLWAVCQAPSLSTLTDN